MIYIWNNGGAYSDWSFHVVESDLPQAEVLSIMRAARGSSSGDDAKVIAVTEHVEWFEARPTPLAKWCDDQLVKGMHYDTEDGDDCPMSFGGSTKCSCRMAPAIDLARRHGLIRAAEKGGDGGNEGEAAGRRSRPRRRPK